MSLGSNGLSATGDSVKAWINFNGTGTIAMREGENVDPPTDNGGVGDYTVNFTNDIKDADYLFFGNGQSDKITNDGQWVKVSAARAANNPNKSYLRIRTGAQGGTPYDPETVVVGIIR